MAKKYTALSSCITGELPPDNPNAMVEVYLASDIDTVDVVFLPEQTAQLRDLLRCVAWIRALQLNEDPENFDLREIFADGVKPYWKHQLDVTRNLYIQLDTYCKANNIPATVWNGR